MNSKDYLLLITRLSRKVITKISLEDWITFTLTTTAHKDGFPMSWTSSSATSWWDMMHLRKLSQKGSSSDGINASRRRFQCASPEIDSSMSMLSSTKIPLKELAVYYLHYIYDTHLHHCHSDCQFQHPTLEPRYLRIEELPATIAWLACYRVVATTFMINYRQVPAHRHPHCLMNLWNEKARQPYEMYFISLVLHLITIS